MRHDVQLDMALDACSAWWPCGRIRILLGTYDAHLARDRDSHLCPAERDARRGRGGWRHIGLEVDGAEGQKWAQVLTLRDGLGEQASQYVGCLRRREQRDRHRVACAATQPLPRACGAMSMARRAAETFWAAPGQAELAFHCQSPPIVAPTSAHGRGPHARAIMSF